jgi:electron transfer flavoprotein alpha subunit
VTVLAVLDHDAGAPSPEAAGVLTAARSLARSRGVDVEALALGAAGENLSPLARDHGVAFLTVAVHGLLDDYGPETWGEAIAQVVGDRCPAIVIAGGTERANEFMASAAARLGVPFVANATSVEPGPPWTLERVRWGGSLLERTELVADVAMLTYATHTLEPAPVPGDVVVGEFTPDIDAHWARSSVVDRDVETEGLTLATAPVVVGGGRGVGSEEGFAVLEELADRLGGVVGCSRVATNNGWRPHSDQVGQTGTRIFPKIYIACGISGAIQHWVGAMGAKAILAINTDPEANMVMKADYAVIGDLHEVVPAVTREIERRLG